MSARSDLVEVSCDGPFPTIEPGECEVSATVRDFGTPCDVRKVLAEDGWETDLPGGYDRCPACRKLKREFQSWRAKQGAPDSDSYHGNEE